MCEHNILVIGAEGNLGPIWLKELALRNPNNLIFGTKILIAEDDSQKLSNVRHIVLDVTNFSEKELRSLIVDNSICRIVYNAGIDTPPNSKKISNFYNSTIDEFRQTLEVNLTGAWNILKTIGPDLETRKHGSIVLIGSLYANRSPDQRNYDHLSSEIAFNKPAAYGASKAGLVHLGKYLSTLWGASGIRVNTLSPGGILGSQDKEFLNKFTKKVPLKRLANASEDVAPVLNFLLSEDSQYVTGQEIFVDGGYTAW
jgi:NAD(P)-dependent dehydrogenase (short-subunit alcohol dehydrogenase family)